MTTYELLKQMDRYITSPSFFLNDLHKQGFENLVANLKHIIRHTNEMLYKEQKTNVESLVESQIGISQKQNRKENIAYWQEVQRRLIKLSRVEEGGERV